MKNKFVFLLFFGLLTSIFILESCLKESHLVTEVFYDYQSNFPATASAYAAMIEPELGVVPTVDVGDMVEMPLYQNGVQVFGAFSETEIDNPTRLGDITFQKNSEYFYLT